MNAVISVMALLLALLSACLADAFSSSPSERRREISCGWHSAGAFIPVADLSPRRRFSRHGSSLRAAGEGFGPKTERRPRFQFSYGGSQLTPMEQQQLWEKSYQENVRASGFSWCAQAWMGYEKMGRGAVMVYHELKQEGEGEGGDGAATATKATKMDVAPTMYAPAEKFSKKAGSREEESHLAQVRRRLDSYDPHKEFVVVFQSSGLMGADIVKPNMAPAEAARIYKEENNLTQPDS
ncbi:unnamed protein product [Vitrella brassicaformis CCMP3155]|uniref:Inhibitor I9 domain-containing protein n=2 Tax=Vitrella brassicaformis TaxID=1169539 RepID=A0A0G4ERJ3_VITBC|nr:unnamed protein product [Vitrella brassicaformis CCMP3155]|eukprot:CEL99908.1 unnamed protein product [Vitrella brassicaformis CCMP3155]